MGLLLLLFYIAIFVIVDWQERKALKEKPRNPQLSLFSDEELTATEYDYK